jgi:hypothetical protein
MNTKRKTHKQILSKAGFDVEELTHVPAASVHKTNLPGHPGAWVDPDAGLLMFVGSDGEQIHRYMYHIGEERNQSVIGVGKDVAAFEISNDRVEWLLGRQR